MFSCLLSGCRDHGYDCDALPGLSQDVGEETGLEGDQLPGNSLIATEVAADV